MASISSTVLWSLNGARSPLRPSVPSMAFYPLYGPLFPQQPQYPSVPSTSLCPLYSPLSSSTYKHCTLSGPLSPLRPSVPSMAHALTSDLLSLNSPLSPLRPYVYSTGLFPLYCALSPLWSSAFSMGLFPLYSPQSSLQPSVLSSALCSLYGPMFPQWPSVPSTVQPAVTSTTLYPLYGPLFPQQPPVPSRRPSVPLRPTVLFRTLCLLYSHLSTSKALCPPPRYSVPSIWSYVPSSALCHLDGRLSLLWPCVPSTPSILSIALCFLNDNHI
jgi:hypothetical protein